ncbi:hypothetical protein [uncultured Tateyamaria sp.]|uniref:hypothetical protein n=1 Tax=uncultured Tateyamaria sp. TaxID=455651 RepID=UPI002630942C|nr:hypothetical protein [uncultured Tateyamaria sp.]
MEKLSFQPPALAGVGIAGGDVGLAGARQVEANVRNWAGHGGEADDVTKFTLTTQLVAKAMVKFSEACLGYSAIKPHLPNLFS